MFQASLDNLHAMLEKIRNSAKQCRFEGTNLQHIEIAAEEVLVNIIHYGYPQHPGSIEIDCHGQPGHAIQVRIADWGIPYNPLVDSFSRKKSDTGGHGIALLFELMDEISYQRINEQNILTLTKYS